MKPLFHPQLVNDPFGDPALYVEQLFERRALLFDVGEIQSLPARKVLRLTHIFVSHTHMDHFVGLDRVLRICLGRGVRLHLYGPPGFVDQVEHKVLAYTWNLVANYAENLVLVVTELHPDGATRTAELPSRDAYRRRDVSQGVAPEGVLLDEPHFRVRAVALDHGIPSLAYTLEEKRHINVWKNRLDELGLPTGPWLRELKDAVVCGTPEDAPFTVRWHDRNGPHERRFLLGDLKREVLRIVPGQKITYVVDTAYQAENARRIVELARGSDVLYIEASFLHEDLAHAMAKHHLTARQAGLLARAAGAKRLVPFHYSQKYAGGGERLYTEAHAAFEEQRAQPMRRPQ
jgi:ribonuclease Z